MNASPNQEGQPAQRAPIISSTATTTTSSPLSTSNSPTNRASTTTTTIIIKCAFCGKENPTNMCSKCSSVYYCDQQCQKSHWNVHKPQCQQLKLLKEQEQQILQRQQQQPEEGEEEEEEEEEEDFIDLNNAEIVPDDGEPIPNDVEGEEANDENEEEIEDDSTTLFKGHSDSVLCVDIRGSMAISGGCDDRAFIWKITNGEVLHELKGHTDSVSCVAFSPFDDSLVATGSLDGTVKIWNAETGNLISTLEGPGEGIEFLVWHDKGPVIVAGSGDGTCFIWNVKNGSCLAVLSGHQKSVLCGCLTSQGKRIATGGADGTLRIWNPSSPSTAEHIFKLESDVISIASSKTEPIILCGCADGRAVLCSTTTGKVLSTLTGHQGSVESVGFANISEREEAPITGGSDFSVRIWSQSGHSQQTERGICKMEPGGVIRMKVHQQNKPLVYVCTSDGRVNVWDIRNSSCVAEFYGHSNAILDLAISPDGKTIVTASDDKTCRVFTFTS